MTPSAEKYFGAMKLPAAVVPVLLSLVLLVVVIPHPASGADVCACPAGCPVCEPLQVSMDASLSKNILEYGESANVSISVRNSEPNLTTLGCDYSAQGQQTGSVPNVTNDGQWHEIGLIEVTAPQEIVEHQTGVNVPVDVNCSAQLANQSGIAWCGAGCSSFVLTYVYPVSENIAEHRGAQLDAVNKLSLARSAIAAAESMITKAESAGSTSSYLNLSKEKLAIANDFLTDASFMYDQLAFDLSVNNSESAIAYADDAESLAYLAYGVASPATSYSYVLRLIEETEQDGGHTYDEIKQITDTLNAITGISGGGSGGMGGGALQKALEDEKQSLEDANRLLDEARKKLKAGDYTGAVEKAVTAKGLVEKARDALDSAFLSVKNGFIIAVENAYKSLLVEMDGVSKRIDAASTQSGINLEEIKFGRDSIDYARFRLIRASALVKDVRNANDIAGLLKAASSAVLELRSARSHVQDAALHSYFSFMKRYTAIGILSVGAALLGIVIWWIEKRRAWTMPKAAAKTEVPPAEKQKPVNAQEILPAKRSKKKGSLRPTKKKAKTDQQ